MLVAIVVMILPSTVHKPATDEILVHGGGGRKWLNLIVAYIYIDAFPGKRIIASRSPRFLALIFPRRPEASLGGGP